MVVFLIISYDFIVSSYFFVLKSVSLLQTHYLERSFV